jgi:hypothetical protein
MIMNSNSLESLVTLCETKTTATTNHGNYPYHNHSLVLNIEITVLPWIISTPAK